MASARAKLRVFLAWVRSATRASMSASERARVARELLGGGLIETALFFSPGECSAGVVGVVIFEDGEDSVEEIQDAQDFGGVAGAEGSTWSAAELAARTRSKIAARASAVLRSLARAAV